MQLTGCRRDSDDRLRYRCLSMMFPGARLFQTPFWYPSRGGATREAGSTVAESLTALYRVGTHQIRRGRRAVQSSTSYGSAKPLCATTKDANREVSKGKLISDHGLFSFYEDRQGAANAQDRAFFYGSMHRALDDWMLVRAPASPAQGLHQNGPQYYDFPYLCIMCGIEKVRTGWGVICPLLLRTLGVCSRQ